MEEYKVKLNDFEGPLDILLELIEKEKMSISDISLASVCDQFLDYTKHFEELQPNYLVNFLVIASKLILIKSKSLLPFLELTDEEEEGIEELKDKLEEFQRIKKGAEHIKRLEEKKSILYERFSGIKNVKVFLFPGDLNKDTLKDLFVGVWEEQKKEEENPLLEKRIEAIVSFEEKLSEIRDRLTKKAEEYFHNVSDKKSKVNTIIAFLAVLELAKQRFLITEQSNNFGDIKIKKI